MNDLDTFREQTRAWLEANCPEEMHWKRGAGSNLMMGDGLTWGGRKEKLEAPARRWLQVMAERGWTAPSWPKSKC